MGGGGQRAWLWTAELVGLVDGQGKTRRRPSARPWPCLMTDGSIRPGVEINARCIMQDA